MSFFEKIKSVNQQFILPMLNDGDFKMYIKREDQIHPIVSGNKFRKLKYNVQEAKGLKKNCLITFGGAYSNHLLATAYVGKNENLKTLAFVRGEELKNINYNSTLQKCNDFGMKLIFISREDYRKRNEIDYINYIKNKFKDSYIIPEGGTNEFGVLGCEEILSLEDSFFDVICCPVGSGGTIAGIINSSNDSHKVLGFSALKGSEINNVITKFTDKKNWKIFDDDIFGGYAKIDNRLVSFINNFFKNTGMILDPIYNSKMLFKIIKLIENNQWGFGKKILLINTGGLQSIKEMNNKLKKKGCEIIKY
ncbi:MAG: pyridoxal-phosphate dependent enzyme [Bacteroidetes bacterium]|jgi:1-aminocyclopropane-1-carboxylate deaminase|nr:pyridoxal-phosphate dependent enzyme [Bacteroidota bacterium]MDA0995308.1 pyridoxal-phosphate dependent enzyme [Pseudomonadota bacterium]|tara:strand:+ start:7226 stop:8146 length:921 start_codon:yes stop_codon:yes gene_type:complete